MSRLTPERMPEFWGALAAEARRNHAPVKFFERKQQIAMADKIRREIKQERKAKRSA